MKELLSAGLLVSALLLAEAAHAKKPALPIFPAQEVAGEENPVRPILDAYDAQDYASALFQTEELLARLSPHDPLAEATAFLLGDLHLESAETVGGSDPLYAAISAFQNAIVKYPESENAVRGLVRMGEAYRALKFYPESIASFKRVLAKHSKSPFAVSARLGIGETYNAWGKWKEAAETYGKFSASKLSLENRRALHRGQADVAYQSGDYDLAYRRYQGVNLKASDYGAEDRRTLFQYGDAAYRTGRLKQAREVFLAYYDVFQKDPLAPVALARVGETWRVEKKDPGAVRAYESIRNMLLIMEADTPGRKAGKLVSEIGSLARKKECAPVLPQIRPSDCLPRRADAALGEGADGLPRSAREVIHLSHALMQETPLAPVFQEILFASAKALRGQGLLDVPLEIENHLLPAVGVPPTRFQEQVRAAFQRTVKEAVAERSEAGDHEKVTEIYYRYPTAFSPAMRAGVTGMQVARSLAGVGLLSDAAGLYEAIAIRTTHPLAEEALARLGKIRFQQGEYVGAHQNTAQFLSRYPTGGQSVDVMQGFGDLLAKENETDLAIEKYNDWLLRHPNHASGGAVLSSLADAYVQKGALKEAAATYARLMEKEDEPTPDLYVSAADVRFKLGEYKDAAALYERVIEMDPQFKHVGWARLQLGNSYRALGQMERGQALFVRLAEEASDPIIRQMAMEKAHIFKGGQ